MNLGVDKGHILKGLMPLFLVNNMSDFYLINTFNFTDGLVYFIYRKIVRNIGINGQFE